MRSRIPFDAGKEYDFSVRSVFHSPQIFTNDPSELRESLAQTLEIITSGRYPGGQKLDRSEMARFYDTAAGIADMLGEYDVAARYATSNLHILRQLATHHTDNHRIRVEEHEGYEDCFAKRDRELRDYFTRQVGNITQYVACLEYASARGKGKLLAPVFDLLERLTQHRTPLALAA